METVVQGTLAEPNLDKTGPVVVDKNVVVVGVSACGEYQKGNPEYDADQIIVVGKALEGNGASPFKWKKMVAASICMIAIVAAGIVTGVIVAASGHGSDETQSGQQMGVRGGSGNGGRQRGDSRHFERPDFRGYLLLSVDSAEDFIADDNSAVALATAIAHAMHPVTEDMVLIRRIWSLGAAGQSRRLLISNSSVRVNYAIRLGSGIEKQAIAEKMRTLSPSNLTSELADTMEVMKMDHTVEITVISRLQVHDDDHNDDDDDDDEEEEDEDEDEDDQDIDARSGDWQQGDERARGGKGGKGGDGDGRRRPGQHGNRDGDRDGEDGQWGSRSRGSGH